MPKHKTTYGWWVLDICGLTATEVAEAIGTDPRNVQRWLGDPEQTNKQFNTLMEGIDKALIAQGRPSASTLGEGIRDYEPKRLEVCAAMSESLGKLIELLKNDARSLKILENIAWGLFIEGNPTRPEIFDNEIPHTTTITYKPDESTTETKIDWPRAKEQAEEIQKLYDDAAAAHKRAAVAAGDQSPLTAPQEPAAPIPWAWWEQYCEELQQEHNKALLSEWVKVWPKEEQNCTAYRRLLARKEDAEANKEA